MSRQWIRHFKCQISGGGKSLDMSDLRVTFKIVAQNIQSPAIAEVTIYNISEDTGRSLSSPKNEMKDITIEAGYRDNPGQIFKGQIKDAIYGRETGTDTYLFLNCAAEFGYNDAQVNKTLDKECTQKDIYDECMKALKEHGLTEGEIQPKLQETRYPRAVVMYGMARDFLRMLAISNDATWFIDQGELFMIERKKTRRGGGRRMNSMSGMIGMPAQTFGGIIVKCLIDPKLRPGCQIEIDEKSIQGQKVDLGLGGNSQDLEKGKLPKIATDGKYKIVKVDIDGDSRGTNWYCVLTCLSANEETYVPPSLVPYLGDH